MAVREIFIDLQNAAFVAGLRGGGLNAGNFPKPHHVDLLDLRVRLLVQNQAASEYLPVSPFTVLTPTGITFSLRVYLAATPWTLLATAATWTVVTTTLTGNLDLATAAMATAVTSLSPLQELDTILEAVIEQTGGKRITVRQYPFPIRKALYVASS
jgi:hypothetical protein